MTCYPICSSSHSLSLLPFWVCIILPLQAGEPLPYTTHQCSVFWSVPPFPRQTLFHSLFLDFVTWSSNMLCYTGFSLLATVFKIILVEDPASLFPRRISVNGPCPVSSPNLFSLHLSVNMDMPSPMPSSFHSPRLSIHGGFKTSPYHIVVLFIEGVQWNYSMQRHSNPMRRALHKHVKIVVALIPLKRLYLRQTLTMAAVTGTHKLSRMLPLSHWLHSIHYLVAFPNSGSWFESLPGCPCNTSSLQTTVHFMFLCTLYTTLRKRCLLLLLKHKHFTSHQEGLIFFKCLNTSTIRFSVLNYILSAIKIEEEVCFIRIFPF